MTDPALEQDPPARDWLRDHLGPVLPKRWQQVWSEAAADDVERIRLRLAQTSIERHPQAPGAHLVVFTATVTVPSDDPDAAEATLDDAMEELLWLLDSLNITWRKADKGAYSGRLGYRFELELATFRKQP